MPAQQFSNNAQTTLTAQCNPADASIAVASAAAFPANTPYTVLIDTEYLLVTSGAGTTTWGVTRAQEGSSAGTHVNGSTVTQDLTLAGLQSLNQSFYPSWAVSGLTGAVQASRYVGATASGPPGSGSFVVGDFIVDQRGLVWVCTTAGSPGTWRAGGNPALLNARTPLVTALPSPLLNTQFRIQSEGAFVAATDGSGHYTVTFPVAFATGLLSVVQSIAANAFGGGQLAMISSSLTGYTGQATNAGGAPLANSSQAIGYIAIGW